jgi:hypothetical protein
MRLSDENGEADKSEAHGNGRSCASHSYFDAKSAFIFEAIYYHMQVRGICAGRYSVGSGMARPWAIPVSMLFQLLHAL